MTTKNFNKQTFVISTTIVGILLVPAFLAALSEDEGTFGKNIIWVAFDKLFYVLRFPTHTLLWETFSNGGAATYFAGLVINCIFYGVLTERLISLFKAQAK